MGEPARLMEEQPGDQLADIGKRAGHLGVEIADVAGIVTDLASIGAAQAEHTKSARAAADALSETNAWLADSMGEARATANNTRVILGESADAITGMVQRSTHTMRSLGESALSFRTQLEDVDGKLRAVQTASKAIESIAKETRLLALNASVEAARAGDAGRGFAIIAIAVKTLADQIASFSGQTAEHLVALTATLEQLKTHAESNAGEAQQAIEETETAARATATLHTLVQSVGELVSGIDSMAQPVERNVEEFAKVRTELEELDQTVERSGEMLERGGVRTNAILEISEDLMLFIAQSGIRTPDTPIIEIAQHKAAEIAALFTAAVDRGELTLADLFDEKYQPIDGTNPQQMLTRFTGFTDRYLPDLQEPVLQMDPRITFCAAVDRNGYLPTHNRIYSKPQGKDPVWNTANCRNRRIFSDRTGLSAGRNQKPFLLQTYRRDMGGGTYALMKDCSAPIYVKGRHWGGFRIGFKV